MKRSVIAPTAKLCGVRKKPFTAAEPSLKQIGLGEVAMKKVREARAQFAGSFLASDWLGQTGFV
jgi:hypothetical protein